VLLETHLCQAARVLLESAIRIAPPDTRNWGQAMRGELNYVEGPWAWKGRAARCAFSGKGRPRLT